MPPCNPHAGRQQYALWICDKDETGASVDPQFIRAAYELAPTLLRYRKRELGCESIAADLIQAAVNAASRAAHFKPVGDPSAYLFTVFSRKVNRHLQKANVEVTLAEEFVDDLVRGGQDQSSTTQTIEDRILLREFKAQMDDWTRKICNMKLVGYSIEEIARDLGEPTNRVAVRYTRGITKAAKRLFHSHLNGREWKPDE